MDLKNARRKLVVLKFTLSRGYAWVQTPGMMLIIAGVISPYIKQYLEISMWFIAVLSFFLLVSVGLIDKKLKLVNAESSYTMELNSLFMKRLDTLESKIDLLSNEN